MGLIDFSLGDIGGVFKDIREAITGEAIKDPTKMAEINLKLEVLENQLKQGQIAINKAEATNPNVFVAGARPFILWVCGFAVAYSFILAPFLHSTLKAMNIVFPLPEIDMGVLFQLMTAMLGMSGLRTYEKLKGIDTKRISPIKPAEETTIKAN